jgi:ABC-type phosphate transport system substrate-binding protein
MTSRILLVALALALAGIAADVPAQVGFKVVAHPGVPVGSLPAAEVSAMLLKKTTKWSDGTAVVPVDLGLGSPAREAFSRAVHKKSAAAIDAHWQKQIFAGIQLPPVTKAADAEVLALVRATPGAIGYVSAAADTAGLKTIELR